MPVQVAKQEVAGLAGLARNAPRHALIGWLESNDKNGAYSDDDCDAEGCPRLSVDEAWGLISVAVLDLDDDSTVLFV